MLAIWRLHGVDRILRTAWEAGVVLAGLSAGSICWFEAGTTDSFGPDLRPSTTASASCRAATARTTTASRSGGRRIHRLVAEGLLPAGYAADDGAALVFEGTELREVVASRPEAAAYRVEAVDGVARETQARTSADASSGG